MRVGIGPETVLGERKEGTGSKNAKCSTKETGAVRNVHSHMLGVTAIEHCIAIWQMLPIAQSNLDLTLHFQERGQFVSRLDKRTCDIDAAYPAAKALRQIARRTANAATDINDMVTGSNRQNVSQFNGGGKSTRVKMIDRCQLLHGYGVRRKRRRLHRLHDARVDVTGSPMI